MVVGLFLDGWAHHHLAEELESFFTPWHAVLYSGATALGGILLIAAFLNYRKGYRLKNILPREYLVALIGFILFGAAGILDLLWHEVFGIEENVEALYSPSHLLLFSSGIMGVGTLFRALWEREKIPQELPHIISAALVLCVLSFVMLPLHPFVHPMMGNLEHNPASNQLDLIVGIAGIVIFSALLVGVILLLMRRIKLPFGSIALIIFLNVLAMSYLKDQFRFIVPVTVAGFLADVFLYWSRGGFYVRWGLRFFSFMLPALIFVFYVTTVHYTEGIWWTLHLWTGSIFIAGLTGLTVSFLVEPPGALASAKS